MNRALLFLVVVGCGGGTDKPAENAGSNDCPAGMVIEVGSVL